MAPDTTPKLRPAWPRGLLDGALRTGMVRDPGGLAAWRARMEFRMDLERLGESLDGRMLRDIGLSPQTLENVRQQANASANEQQEDIMVKDSTPSRWPSEPRGLLDDVVDAVRRAGLFRRLGRFLAAMQGKGSASPGTEGGRMSATLEKGQCLALDGPLPATVECLAGAAWITCPAEGRDVQLRAGEAARIESPGNVVVAAVGGPARIRMGWR